MTVSPLTSPRAQRLRLPSPPIDRLLAALVLAATLAGGWACGRGRPAPSSPRTGPGYPIIIFDVDTLRADHLGCYGYSRDTSPRLDALAKESVRFEWAFSQAPNTPPSQTSILTGLYPSTHGMIGDEDRLDDKVTTLAEVLSREGFQTAAFVDGGYLSAVFNIGQGFDLYESEEGQGLAVSGPRAAQWLRKHADEPFLMLVHTYDVHTPYDPPKPYHSMFLDGLQAPSPGFEASVAQMEGARHAGWRTKDPLSEADVEWAKALYDGGIRYADSKFGELLDVVHELGLDEKAILVLISDHGEEFQEHGSVEHEKLYATVTRIPLLIRLPGGRGARVVSDVVESIDLMPTLLALERIPVPAEVEGRSLLPLLEGKELAPRAAVAESSLLGEQRAVTLGTYRMLYRKTPRRSQHAEELYAYREDPLEQHDVANEHGDQIAALEKALARWRELLASRHSFAAGSPQGNHLNPETEKQLRALGYLN